MATAAEIDKKFDIVLKVIVAIVAVVFAIMAVYALFNHDLQRAFACAFAVVVAGLVVIGLKRLAVVILLIVNVLAMFGDLANGQSGWWWRLISIPLLVWVLVSWSRKPKVVKNPGD